MQRELDALRLGDERLTVTRLTVVEAERSAERRRRAKRDFRGLADETRQQSARVAAVRRLRGSVVARVDGKLHAR